MESGRKKFKLMPIVGVIHRAELVGILSKHFPNECSRYGAECVDVFHGSDQVTVTFEDGTSDTGDFLVGADGIRSIVRAKIFGDQPVFYAGYTCFRGICPRPPSIALGYLAEWWGRGQRVGITTLTRDRVYWWVTINGPANMRIDNAAEYVRRKLSDWADPMPEMFQSTLDDSIL